MKVKTSVALEEETLVSMRELVKKGNFRNKSHVMEFAVRRLIEED
ncbi:ribbon-helix-helix domain-containing protein [Candidatus Woesearchaeota archaeon]|nr:ribbon-helix-helix domain-containing protein [Candidatus Woesearchaeota archaeon]